MSYVSNEKGWPQDILDDPYISSVDEEKGIWIYCQVFMKEVKMTYYFNVSIWYDHAIYVLHKNTKSEKVIPKQERHNLSKNCP